MRVFKDIKVSFKKPTGFWGRLFPAKWMKVKIEMMDIYGYPIGEPFEHNMSAGDSIAYRFDDIVGGLARQEEEID